MAAPIQISIAITTLCLLQLLSGNISYKIKISKAETACIHVIHIFSSSYLIHVGNK